VIEAASDLGFFVLCSLPALAPLPLLILNGEEDARCPIGEGWG
jgi:hypothetical protein